MRLMTGVFLALLAASVAAPEPAMLGYLGGSGTDDCDGIAVDAAGDLYLACHSDSSDFPGLPPKAAPISNDSMDAVVVKIGRTGRLVWATRTGGARWDAAGDIAIAKDGSVYVAGSTRSIDFPTTSDAVQPRFGGPDRDAFLLKLDANGRIVYSTLLGGSKNDELTEVALAPDGTVLIAGVTMSADFPGRIAQIGPGGGPDAFIARLRPGDPNSLRSVVIGGNGQDSVTGLALDSSGNLFAAGYTSSPDFPAAGGVQPRFAGGIDAFLLKLRASDFMPRFSTFLGGSKMDGAYAVALDPAGNPIVSGVTESADFPATAHAFQRRLHGSVDAFVAKVASDGSRVLWSTYYGGSKANSDQFQGGRMALDDRGRVWLTGMTASADLPTSNAFQPAYGGGDFDGFVAAFSGDGSRLCYGSYAGGSGHDILEGIAVAAGRVFASGLTSSAALKQKAWKLQAAYGGGSYDALIVGLGLPADSCR